MALKNLSIILAKKFLAYITKKKNSINYKNRVSRLQCICKFYL